MSERTRAVNMAKAMELAGRVGDDFAAAHAVALGFIGDRLGIFRALAEHGPLTSAELAERTGLNERYVREWAAAMAASGYITYGPDDATFSMTPEQVQVLVTRNPLNAAGGLIYAIACIRQLPKLMDAFRDGGGVAFADFGPEIVEAIERLFAPGYELFVAHQWIPAIPELHAKLKQGAEVAEVGCGAGQALIPVTLAFPQSRFTGYEIDTTGIEQARIKAAKAGVAGRVSFEQVSAEEIADEHRYDLIMAFNCIHDMSNPRGAFARNAAWVETGRYCLVGRGTGFGPPGGESEPHGTFALRSERHALHDGISGGRWRRTGKRDRAGGSTYYGERGWVFEL